MDDSLREARAAAKQHLKSRDFRSVIETTTAALESAPSDAGLLMLRGVARMQLGELQPGVDDLRAAATEKPDDAQLQFNLGNGFAMLDKPEAAVRAYVAALKVDSGYAPARQALAKLDPDALSRIVEAAAQAAPVSPPSPLASEPVEVAMGLDGEPLPAAAARLATAYDPPALGKPREPSRPTSEPGSLAFVRTWYWIVYALALLSGLAFIGLQAKVARTMSPGGLDQQMQEAMKGMTPEQQQEMEASLAEIDAAMKELGGDQATEAMFDVAQAGIRVTMIAIAVGLVLSGVLTWLIAKGLGGGAAWGWWLAMICSVFGLLAFPLTIGYIVVIIFLVKPESKAWCGLA